MPRPGPRPRPYECVRRSWHSDRHHPIRGSIIQQVFRLVNEAHSLKTKKNREWQEKLPVVVLKAEEIMYSKANSEAEYVNLETLWDRVNDAINIIIRRDECAETGQFLPPCVEAALNLGCVPVRASRSQRQSNIRNYLPPKPQGSSSVPPRVFDAGISEQCQPSNFNYSPHRRSPSQNPDILSPESERRVIQHDRTNAPGQSSHSFPSRNNQSMKVEADALLDIGMVYPLYYGTEDLPVIPHSPFSWQEKETSHTILVGVPVARSLSQSAKTGVLKDLFCSEVVESNLKRSRANFSDRCEEEPRPTCDLSLRLGLSSSKRGG